VLKERNKKYIVEIVLESKMADTSPKKKVAVKKPGVKPAKKATKSPKKTKAVKPKKTPKKK
jgi:hypothetical protein